MSKRAQLSPPGEIQRDEAIEIESQLRGCAPALPLALKSRTLSQCSVRAEAKLRRQRRLHWQLVGTVAGVLALQSTTLFVVEAQNTQLLAGDSKPPLFASLSVEQISQLWQQRSRQLAQLMAPSEVG